MAGQIRGNARGRSTRERRGAGYVDFETDWEGGSGPWGDQGAVFDEIGEIGFSAPRPRNGRRHGWAAYETGAESDAANDAGAADGTQTTDAAVADSVGYDGAGSSAASDPTVDDGGDGGEPSTWQTPDGDVLHLPPAVLNALLLRLRRRPLRPGRPGRPGRRPRPGRPRRPARPPAPAARRAVTRRIGQLVRGARRAGAMRNPRTGQRFPVFSSRGRRGTFQMVTRPRGRNFEIQMIRPVASTAADPGRSASGHGGLLSEIGTIAPEATPISHLAPFAPLPAANAVWPVLTTDPSRLVVSYKRADGKIVGRDGRRFHAGRVRAGKPSRWHAGIDLFARRGDKVVACEDGLIINYGFFYKASTGQDTNFLLVQHPAENPRFIINYGEIRKGSLEEQGLKKGARVKAGQVIGRVSDTDMLHFEMYAPGAKKTEQWLQTSSRPPATLLDPTKYLLALAEKERARTGSPAPPQPAPTTTATAGKWDKAVRNNTLYARQLGWDRHLPAIGKLLGITVSSPAQPALAEAAARWQAKQGLSNDGIIGPTSWARMKSQLSAPVSPATPAPAPSKPASTASAPTIVNVVQMGMLRSFAGPNTPATVANALAITRLIAGFHRIPWRVCFTILEHEGGVKLFKHRDGVMQTISGARKEVLPLIPRPLKLALLELPATDTTSDAQLTTKLHQEFARRLAVQIAAGIEELRVNLARFNGYVALAYQAYNVGPGWSYYTVTPGKSKSRPKGIASSDWERMCREGAALLHLPASQVRVSDGVWQCDKNMPGWFRHYAVFDRGSGRQLIGYKYLRSFVGRYHANRPSAPCNAATHGSAHRQKGSGNVVEETSRQGSLDKLYDPGKLGKDYRLAAGTEISAIPDDGLPLKVLDGTLVKVNADGTTRPV